MGKRHSAKTGDGGAERRNIIKKLNKNNKKNNREEYEPDLVFHHDPSDDENETKNNSELSENDDNEPEEMFPLEINESDDSDDDIEEDINGYNVDNVVDSDDDIEKENIEEWEKINQITEDWGSSTKDIYSADTTEDIIDSEDEEIAMEEEEAALEIQRKQAEQLDDDDFIDFDVHENDVNQELDKLNSNESLNKDLSKLDSILANIPMIIDTDNCNVEMEKVQKDGNKLSNQEKLEILIQTNPEFPGLLEEFNEHLSKITNSLTPTIKKLEEIRLIDKKYENLLDYIKLKKQLLLNYCTNLTVCLMLKSEGKSYHNHPVIKHVLIRRQKLKKMDPFDQIVEKQVNKVLSSALYSSTKNMQKKKVQSKTVDDLHTKKETCISPLSKKSKVEKKNVVTSNNFEGNNWIKDEKISKKELTDAALFLEQIELKHKNKIMINELEKNKNFDETNSVECADTNDKNGRKRGATYQIMKNKGLQAYKKKENRNPRVRKKMQYKKAVVRRKGQVRDIRVGEIGKYAGEMTGIKANISRSRKIYS